MTAAGAWGIASALAVNNFSFQTASNDYVTFHHMVNFSAKQPIYKIQCSGGHGCLSAENRDVAEVYCIGKEQKLRKSGTDGSEVATEKGKTHQAGTQPGADSAVAAAASVSGRSGADAREKPLGRDHQ